MNLGYYYLTDKTHAAQKCELIPKFAMIEFLNQCNKTSFRFQELIPEKE